MKRLLHLVLATALFVTLFTGASFETSAAGSAEQVKALQNFQVIYVIGQAQVPIGAEAVSFALVTPANLAAVQADALNPSTPGSGKVLCGGVEMALPEALTVTDGYVTDVFGNVMLSEAALYNYLLMKLGPYETAGMERLFMTTKGELIQVGGGNYGAMIDLTAELKHLIAVIQTHTKEARYPQYASKAYGAAENAGLPLTYSVPDVALGYLPVAGNALYDIGQTYVEIDLDGQKLYYYKDGELTLSTSIVTGDTHLKRGTPDGVFYLYAKQQNRTLRGEDYEAFVKYWMPIYKAIGMHDASWRGKFGGEIYKTNGSHGCINMPTAAAKQLYESIRIGTPVVVY